MKNSKSRLDVTEFPGRLKTRSDGLYQIKTLKAVARRTSLSVNELRDLLRSGEVVGAKARGIWLTTIAAVKHYEQRTSSD